MKHTTKIKKKITHHVSQATSYFIYRACYITGLAILIPMMFAFAVGGVRQWYSSPFTYLCISILFILLSFVGLLRRKRHYGETLKGLGKISLIPGVVALVLFLLGKEIVLGILRILPGFWSIDGLVDAYLENAIPKMGILVIGYLAIGGLLYFIGSRLKK